MNSISFTFFRHDIDPNLNLQVRVGIAGTAILGVDYNTLDFDSITNLSSMPVGTLVIPAGIDSRKVVCTATPGLVQADRTVTFIVQDQPGVLTVDPIAPQATGVLSFPSPPRPIYDLCSTTSATSANTNVAGRTGHLPALTDISTTVPVALKYNLEIYKIDSNNSIVDFINEVRDTVFPSGVNSFIVDFDSTTLVTDPQYYYNVSMSWVRVPAPPGIILKDCQTSYA